MKILIVCYSRTGCTEKLADRIARDLTSRGHGVHRETLDVVNPKSCWNLLFRQLHQYPLVGLSLICSNFYRRWVNSYHQPEEAIRPPVFADVSAFDHVCIGGPKWAYTSYPVARYLKQIKGLRHKPVSAFATFGGPPLNVFELDFIFTPMARQIRKAGGIPASTLGLSSNYHELHLIGIFRLFSRLVLRRPLRSFTVESHYGEQQIASFCEAIDQETPQ